MGAIREMKSQLQCGATYINDSPSPRHVSLRLPPQLTPPANDNSDLPAHEHMQKTLNACLVYSFALCKIAVVLKMPLKCVLVSSASV